MLQSVAVGVNCQVDEIQHHLKDGTLDMLLGDHLDFVICCLEADGGLHRNGCLGSYI